MADKYWRGTAGDGDWSNTNNWSATRFGSTGAGAPASNDVVYIVDGNYSITTGLNAASTDLDGFTVGPNYTGNIGTSSAPLQIAVSGTSGATMRIKGIGGQYIKITAGTNGIDVLDIEETGAGTFYLVGGTTTDAYFGTGNVVVEAGAVLTNWYSAGANIDLADNGTDCAIAELAGGTCRSRRDLDAVIVGPTAVLTTLEDVTVDGSIDVSGVWNCQSSGTVASLKARPTARVTAQGSSATALTITSLVKYAGAQVFENDSFVTISATRKVGRARG
jgi:hypothetical protein